MKKPLLFLLITFLVTLNTFSQETKDSKPAISRNHEIKLGAIKLLSGGIFEVSYEYILDTNQGFGAALLLNLDTGNQYVENYSLTPFYRMYFQTKEDYGAKGFFVEGFVSFFGGKNYYYTYDMLNTIDDNFFDTSVGLSLGKKWINSAGFVFEFKVGAGRNLLNGSEFDALFKGDLYIGYRF
ncbi:hypothetical protein ACFQ0I_01560 [Mariniflexile aquimaris]|uniref:DUF3575 domain-containing protein n=1 Tax=Mariniflexile aquimaris TaxID=881009 RepID=A0ABW3BMY3_9FLAO